VRTTIDELAKSPKIDFSVIPAKQTVSQLNAGVIPDSPTKEGEIRARSASFKAVRRNPWRYPENGQRINQFWIPARVPRRVTWPG